ncbi:M56 family metallopeptidase [Amycolatopsis roodepoortensis]|uniref:M56 family metallopeptidase n=1 Tax=Amycolatopsis roodepoortensis TaxID=700274 RepID=UPI00214C8762|nr:M56 family metallopeptidase [Amycolatopsis roodepoortensis]UUV28694.1 M56 family metallopeptidase [Amycolatopsis roodepoortensis]
MILAAALLLGAVVIGWWSPRALSRLTAAGISPGTAIAWWLMTAMGVLAGTLAGVLLLVLPGHGPAEAITEALHDCWAAVSHDGLPALDPIVGTVASVVLLAAAGRLAMASAGRRRRSNLLHQRHLDALRLVGVRDPRPIPTLWLPDDQPIAYSLGGRRALIVASRGLAGRLSEQELAAVLAHERAHVHGCHHLLTGCAEVVGRTLRFIPLMRTLPAAVQLLVELAADRTAASQWGPEPVRSALVSIRSADGPRRALAMAGGDTAIRLQHLAEHRNGERFSARLTAVVGGATALLAPALFAVGLLAAASLISCA